MTIAARLAALLLRATADALDAFANSLTVQRVRVPATVPDWMNEEQNL